MTQQQMIKTTHNTLKRYIPTHNLLIGIRGKSCQCQISHRENSDILRENSSKNCESLNKIHARNKVGGQSESPNHENSLHHKSLHNDKRNNIMPKAERRYSQFSQTKANNERCTGYPRHPTSEESNPRPPSTKTRKRVNQRIHAFGNSDKHSFLRVPLRYLLEDL